MVQEEELEPALDLKGHEEVQTSLPEAQESE